MNTKPAGLLMLVVALLASSAAAEDAVLKLAIAHGPGEKQLQEFAKHLETTYRVDCEFVRADKSKQPAKDADFAETPFENIEAIEHCDAILSNLYRTWAPKKQMAVLKRNFAKKPVVGLRKAHHGFQNWLEADQQVFGADYRGHYFGKEVTQQIVAAHRDHRLLAGLDPLLPKGGLYSHVDLADDVEVYIVGGPKDREPMPQTWSRVNAETGQRVFYTRYDPQDLSNPTVRDMVARAIFWAADKDIDKLRR